MRSSTKIKPHLFFSQIVLAAMIVLFGVFQYFRLGLLWSFLLSVNLITLCLYGYDKWASGRKHLRVPEVVLHALAVAGGSVAALGAQQIFKHKRRKTSFILWYAGICAGQLAVLFWLLSSWSS